MELRTIAKPYASAIVALAEQNNTQVSWGEFLQAGTQLANDKVLQDFITAPNATKANKFNVISSLFNTILARDLTKEEISCIELLLKNSRMKVLPSILDLFNKVIAAIGEVKDFDVFSAYALSSTEEQKIIDNLAAKYNTKVSINTFVDKCLVGGIVVKEGDKVVDMSVKARIEELDSLLSVN